jgi:hypothetical protein
MHRFLNNLRRLASPAGTARRGSRRVPSARPGLEALEARDVPTTLGLTAATFFGVPTWKLNAFQLAAPVQSPALSLPSPAMLAGKVVALGQAGNPSNTYGTLTILSTSLQADGSYTFQGVYLTSSWSVNSTNLGPNGQLQPALLSVSGTLGAPQYTTLFNATFSIYFNTVESVLWSHDGSLRMVDEHVNFNATVTMNGSQATVLGQLYDCLEDPVTHMAIDPFCGSPSTSGTFR